MEHIHYYLMSGVVKYTKKGVRHSCSLNTLVTTKNQFVTRHDIGQTQQAMQVRLFREIEEPHPKTIVEDVYIEAVNYLGFMSPDEFDAGMPAVGVEATQASQATHAEDVPAQDAVERPSEYEPPPSILDPEPDTPVPNEKSEPEAL